MNSAEDVWAHVLDILKSKLTPVAISTWFSECSVVSMTEEKMVICVPSDFKRGIVETRFRGDIQEALRELFSGDYDISFVGAELPDEAEGPSGGSEVYTFQNFVVGSSNKFAYAAAMAVAEEQTKNYNPLFIYGGSGLGKTHLLYAIRNELKRRHPGFNVVLVRGGDFVSELVTAVRIGRADDFKEKYRTADALLIDDIQVIAGKAATEEEVFNTFNSLHEAQKQIVFTSDRPPEEMLTLPERLKSRFSSGLLADILPPDYETRMAIIRNKSIQLGIQIPGEVMDYIAKSITANVRQMEGAVKIIKAKSELMKVDITVPMARDAISDLIKDDENSLPTPDDIITATANYYSLEAKDIKGKSQINSHVNARQVAMYLIKQLINLTTSDIGNIFGRDHSTVIYSINKVAARIPKDRDLSITIKDITANITNR